MFPFFLLFPFCFWFVYFLLFFGSDPINILADKEDMHQKLEGSILSTIRLLPRELLGHE